MSKLADCEDDMSDECPICYEPFATKANDDIEKGSPEAGITISSCCDVAYCTTCLADYCKHSIQSNQIPIVCPATTKPPCGQSLDPSLVKDVLLPSGIAEESKQGKTKKLGHASDSTEEQSPAIPEFSQNYKLWQRFHRSHSMLEDPTLVACTKCEELCSNDTNPSPNLQGIDASSKQQLLCPSCDHEFCAIHGDAHSNKTCLQHDRQKKSRQAKRSEKIIRKFTKPCSHCAAPIHKEAGCDHIVCPSCNQDFCFKCGSHENLTGGAIRTCEKCKASYLDHRHMWTYRLYVLFSLPCYLPMCILHMAVMLVLSVVSLGCCCFCGCGYMLDDDEDGINASGTDRQHSPTAATNNPPSNEQKKTHRFQPLKGIKTVLFMIFLPLLDIAGQCGITCCLRTSDLRQTNTMESDSINDSDSDIDDDDNV